MQSILEKLFTAADNHGEDAGEPDHTVGDLQDLLRRAWDLMNVSQKMQLLKSDEVENIVELGARGEFEVEDLMVEVSSSLEGMTKAILEAGYELGGSNRRFDWRRHPYGCSSQFVSHEDCVADAYRHLQATQRKTGK